MTPAQWTARTIRDLARKRRQREQDVTRYQVEAAAKRRKKWNER